MKNITDQNGLIVIADIDANKLSILCNELHLLHTAIINKADHPFRKIKGIHFARFVIFPDPLSAQPPGQLFRLVYSGTYDGQLDAYLQAMTAGETISPFQRIFSCCKDYDPAMPPATALTTFIKGHMQRVDAYYSGYRGLSTDMISQEAEIYTLIQQFLRERTFAASDDPKLIKQEIVQYLHQQAPGYIDICSAEAIIAAGDHIKVTPQLCMKPASTTRSGLKPSMTSCSAASNASRLG